MFMKKIFFVTNIPTPYRTAFYDALSNECAAKNQELYVMYCAKTEPKRRWPYDYRVMNHKHLVLSGIHPNFMGFVPHFNPSVVIHLERASPRLVVLAGAWNTPTVLLALLWCRLRGVPVYFWSEGHSNAVLNPTGLIAYIRRSVYQMFDGFMVPNARSAKWALDQAADAKTVIRLPNSIDTASFYPPASSTKEQWREKLGLPKDKTILIQVARMDPEKAPVELAQAYLSLPEEMRLKSTLVFVGPGRLEDELRKLSSGHEDSLRVVGNIPADMVREWLWASDIFVLNTKRDPNPLSPIEACSAALPILVSRLAGNVDELVVEGANGWAIQDPDNPCAELARAIMAGRSRLREMGLVAQANITERFDVRNVTRRLLDDIIES
jgi:glycosyltransferase involved in cell wall biosynthesis